MSSSSSHVSSWILILTPLILFVITIFGCIMGPQTSWLALPYSTQHQNTIKDQLLLHEEEKAHKPLLDELLLRDSEKTKVRAAIKEASGKNINFTSIHDDPDYVPQGPIYRNANAFYRSYLEMERLFKIYVYREGEPPMFHEGPCKSIYSTEGIFINVMERDDFFRTSVVRMNGSIPDEAMVYFLPFSVVRMVQYLYETRVPHFHGSGHTVSDYINTISQKHRFWNRSLGADHFMLSCHDWKDLTHQKDVSMPEINLKTGSLEGLVGGISPSRRTILAFFAGHLHGNIRSHLLNHWKGKDNDIQVYEQLPKDISYEHKLKTSRFCLCPSGYEVASP
nr:probable glycosyltransferase At5g03795 [Tanacetum cinerariifolium]